MAIQLTSRKGQELKVTVGGHEVLVPRARLGLWLDLEVFRKATPSVESVEGYLSLCGVEGGSGLEMLRAYAAIVQLNALHIKLPMFTVYDESQISRAQPWDYPERGTITWVHTLAAYYHWSRAEILDLDPDEAAMYVQEISVDKQLASEWDYSLSQNAYSYDESAHSSRFVPLKRPGWMTAIKPKAPPRPVPKSMLPMGPVIDASSILKNVSLSSAS